MPKSKPDNRPRYGYCMDLDKSFIGIADQRHQRSDIFPVEIAVVVIPIPSGAKSSSCRRKIREFVNGTLWPK